MLEGIIGGGGGSVGSVGIGVNLGDEKLSPEVVTGWCRGSALGECFLHCGRHL